MTGDESVKRVLDLLTTTGYRVLEQEKPVMVASVPFEFDALLVGSERANDLIVVIDTLIEPEPRIRQKVQGLSRALDVVGSRRPLTVILVGPSPPPGTLEALGKVSRVLMVDVLSTTEALSDALGILLPLHLPDTTEAVMDPLGELRNRTPATPEKETLAVVYEAAPDGTEAVSEALRALLAEPLQRAVEGPEP
jgi:hypothetical protein